MQLPHRTGKDIGLRIVKGTFQEHKNHLLLDLDCDMPVQQLGYGGANQDVICWTAPGSQSGVKLSKKICHTKPKLVAKLDIVPSL